MAKKTKSNPSVFKKSRRNFDNNFKIKVVKMMVEKSSTEVGKEMGLNPQMITRWKKEFIKDFEEAKKALEIKTTKIIEKENVELPHLVVGGYEAKTVSAGNYSEEKKNKLIGEVTFEAIPNDLLGETQPAGKFEHHYEYGDHGKTIECSENPPYGTIQYPYTEVPVDEPFGKTTEIHASSNGTGSYEQLPCDDLRGKISNLNSQLESANKKIENLKKVLHIFCDMI